MGGFGSAEETDGIALAPGTFSRTFPQGLLLAQDGETDTVAQNFKLVSGRAVKASAGDFTFVQAHCALEALSTPSAYPC